jgi:hypothetical protein
MQAGKSTKVVELTAVQKWRSSRSRMENWAGRGGTHVDEGGVGEKDVDGAGDGGTVDSMDEMVGGPRFWGRDSGVV